MRAYRREVACAWRRPAGLGVAALVLIAPALARADAAGSDLSQMSIEQLGNIEVFSVAKAAQSLSDAPAAIFVITNDDVIRSGAQTLPDMLRLAPNLQVAQISADHFGISARGFNGSVSDKLLVLIDGRSVYTPFYSGVFWNSQTVLPEDIERIEVISGPGATLWGANAVNGVINVVTRKAGDTLGGSATATAGGLMQDASLQYGWRLRPDIALRAYAMGAWHDSDVTATGANAKDLWSKGQAGFRMDWSPGAEQMTLQGDLYRGAEKEAIAERQIVGGGNLVARWTHSFSGGSSLQVQTYYDELSRRVTSVANDRVRTYDLDVQHSFAWGSRQAVVWGAGLRVSQDRFTVVPGNPTSPLTQFFDPESRTLILGDVFAQDTITLTPTLQATVGLKLEDDPYSGMATLPSLRLSWKPTGTMLLWAAASRAIRAPSRLDRDFFETQGATVVLKGGDFQAETLVAYELGYRGEPSDRLSVSVSAFYNVYDDLRTFEYAPGPSLPATIQNMLEGETYGVEVWGGYRVTNWWRLTAGANWLHEDLRFKPGSFKLGGVAIAGNDPTYQALLRSIMNLGPAVSLDLDLRQIGALKSPASPAYAELGGRLAWTVTPAVELALVGANLLHDHHPEFGGTGSAVQLGSSGVESGRSLALGARLRF